MSSDRNRNKEQAQKANGENSILANMPHKTQGYHLILTGICIQCIRCIMQYSKLESPGEFVSRRILSSETSCSSGGRMLHCMRLTPDLWAECAEH